MVELMGGRKEEQEVVVGCMMGCIILAWEA